MKKCWAIIFVVSFLLLCVPLTAAAAASLPELQKPTNLSYTIGVANEDDIIELYYRLPNDYCLLAEEFATNGGDQVKVKYGVDLTDFDLQIDVSLNGESDWLYTAEWDSAEMTGSAAEIAESTAVFDNTNNRIDFLWLTYDSLYEELTAKWPQLVFTDNNGLHHFNWEGNTLYVRARYLMQLEKEGQDKEYRVSEWSDVLVIHPTRAVPLPVQPQELEAPVVSDLRVNTAEGDEPMPYCTVTIPPSVSDAVQCYDITGEGVQSIELQMEYRQDGGDWSEGVVDNSTFPTRVGGRYLMLNENAFDADRFTEVRLRYSYELDGQLRYSPWSAVLSIGTPTYTPTTENAGGTPPSGTAITAADGSILGGKDGKCTLCGFCPVQPLGLCLFVWIAAAVVLVLLVVLILLARKKKKSLGKAAVMPPLPPTVVPMQPPVLPVVAERSAATAGQTPTARVFCTSCGTPNEAGMKFCSHCGQPLEQ